MQVYRAILLVFLVFLCIDGWTKTLPQQQAEPLFIKAVASDTVPGINVAVADSAGVVWAKGYGFADLENHVAMNPQHKMRIGSVSKVITAAALMLWVHGNVIF